MGITDRKLLYIAGPYRAPTINGVYNNIAEARKRMEWAWTHGWIPLCPHTNSAFTDGLVPDTILLTGCLKILSVCDAILLISNWRSSSGTIKEKELAIQLGMEVIRDPLQSSNPEPQTQNPAHSARGQQCTRISTPRKKEHEIVSYALPSFNLASE